MKKILFVSLCFCSRIVFAQDTTLVSHPAQKDSAARHVFTLGEVVVVGEKNTAINTVVDAQKIQRFARTDVAQALDVLPGVNMSEVGPRNESMIYIRGFDLRQVPLLLDGIPVYVPYDGYVDLARFTTFDLAEINISKGYTSVLYGPNAMGGAINLITRRPVNKLELNGATGWLSGGYRTNLNLGSQLGKFYVQAGISRLNRDSFPLSKKFTPVKTEDGGYRNNSYSRDDKFNVKIGYTPNNRSEYALSYIYQHGQKGTPVYAGSDTLNSQLKSPRYWQWPYWDKQSLYFLSNTNIDSTQYIRTRLYYDQFRNELNSYDNASYSTISKPYAFQSIYNDYTIGGIVEYGKKLWNNRDIVKATLQYKQDVHREHNVGEPVRHMDDATSTAGVENELMLLPALKLLTGLSFNNRTSLEAQNYNSTTKTISNFPANNNNAFNLQGGLEYKLDPVSMLHFSIARKTRFATIKDRYSYSLGTALPNPGLSAEYAVNYDLGYNTILAHRLNIQSSLFYSNIHNTILSVNNVQYDSTTHVWLSQVQNVGRSEYLGGEIGLEYPLLPTLKIGANYTYIKMNNLTSPAVRFINVPNHKVFGFVEYDLSDKFDLQVNTEYDSRRYSTTYGTTTGDFTLLNTRAAYKIWKYFSVEGGVNNITDRNYSLVEGYPEPGRNYFVNLLYRY